MRGLVKPFLIGVWIAGLASLRVFSAAQAACEGPAVRSSVEIANQELSLADLLEPGSCPALLRAAAGVRLGRAPLVGSVRVIEGEEVRALLRKLAPNAEGSASGIDMIHIPERVVVRHAGPRSSCAEIGERVLVLGHWRSEIGQTGELSAGNPAPNMECGGVGRIPEGVPLALGKVVWDPASGSWRISARCVQASDCVPFQVRVWGHDLQLRSSPVLASLPTSAKPASALPGTSLEPKVHVLAEPGLVHPGQRIRLLWDENGIRMTLPVICIDAGGVGQRVRARIAPSSRVVRAIVVDAGTLRAAS
jgi:hypothetical protein